MLYPQYAIQIQYNTIQIHDLYSYGNLEVPDMVMGPRKPGTKFLRGSDPCKPPYGHAYLLKRACTFERTAEWCPALCIGDVEVCSGGNEATSNLEEAVLGGEIQRRASVLITHV